MSAIDFDPVWEKSRAFIRRAINARDAARFDEFCFWCAVSLELLGKAMLASIHPALIADPQDVDSMFLACGRPLTSSPRTIIAKTVFGRIQKLSKEFGDKEFKSCMLMMDRRNAELHSGDLPYHNLNPDGWAPSFWRNAELILKVGEKTLSDWIGKKEAALAAELIQEAATVREQSVKVRREKSVALFNQNYKNDAAKKEIRTLARGGALTPLALFGSSSGDTTYTEKCPACGCDGKISAEKLREDEPSDESYHWEDGVVLITVHYAPQAFRCGVCSLRLDGQDELNVLEMADEVESEEQREIEYDDDSYLNE